MYMRLTKYPQKIVSFFKLPFEITFDQIPSDNLYSVSSSVPTENFYNINFTKRSIRFKYDVRNQENS